jgi:hypothetical protein
METNKLRSIGSSTAGAALKTPAAKPTQTEHRPLHGRITLTGLLLTVAVMSGLYAAMFSAYWLILTTFALAGMTQTWSFDFTRGAERTADTAR